MSSSFQVMLKSLKFLIGFIVLTVLTAYVLPWWEEDSTMAEKQPQTLYDFNVTNIDGENVALSTYKGFVCLVVNVASK